MIDTQFLGQLDRFNLIIKKKVNTHYSGERKSDSLGEGLTFKDYREYVRGDDFRLIDWKIYARTDKYFIKRFEEERNMTLHILVDSSASMNFGTKTKKFEYASMIGLGFAHLAMRNNEKFEFSTFDEKLTSFKPKKGKSQMLAIIDYLNSKKVGGKSYFRHALESFKDNLKSKSLVVIISDFLFDMKDLEHILLLLKKSEVILIQVLDEAEKNFNVEGDVLLKDSETGGMLRTFISNRLKTTYKEKLDTHIDRVSHLCDSTGASFCTVTTNQPIFEAFYNTLN